MNFLNKIIDFFGEGVYLPKKGMHVAHYMKVLDKNPGINFQMDFFRKDVLDLQVYRQKLIKDQIDFDIENERGYASELCFFTPDEKSKDALERFKNSELFTKAKLSYSSSNPDYYRYMIFIEENNLKLFNHIKYVIEEIYRYDKDTTYHLKFNKFN
jgi:hypothetical protein